MTSRLALLLPSLLILSTLTACGEDEAQDENNELVVCASGESYNPILGECVPAEEGNNMTANNLTPCPAGQVPDSAGMCTPPDSNMATNTNNQTSPPNNTSTNNTSANTSTNNTSVVLPAGPVDPACVDGLYSEALPTMGSLAAAEAGYSPANLEGFMLEILQARYSVGYDIVKVAKDSNTFDCIGSFVSDKSSATGALKSVSTVVHECGHLYDIDRGGFGKAHYFLTSQTSFTCSRGDTTSRGGVTFERSRLNGDMFASKRPKCNNRNTPGCDFYADVYLDGDPDDAMFEGGDQGFSSVLEETTQYVNSLATAYAFRDRYSNQVSERDGLLTFFWYVGRYLHMARTQYPDAYADLLGDSCWRESILSVWGRGWIYLEATKNERNLGIDDDTIMALVMEPVILEEIQRVRDAHGCGL